jgi:hypothetical protein
MKINRNKQIMLLLYFIVVIFLLIQLYELYSIKNEHFQENKFTNKVNSKNIQSIILSPYNKDIATSKWFGSFIKNSDKDNFNNSLYLYETNSLESGEWTRVSNMLLEKNKKVIITDISFDKSKRMIVIGLFYKNKKPIYNIYRKETTNLDSNWEKISTDINIRSICHDITDDNKIIGISSYDGQIYYNNGDYMNWIGPINYDADVPLRKVMYNLENDMIGIGLLNNNLYEKETSDWNTSNWKLKKTNSNGVINDIKARDLIYNNDGRLIATTFKGIMIQTNSGGLASPFISFETFNKLDQSESERLNIDNKEIFKSKLGFEIDNTNLFDTHNMPNSSDAERERISMRKEAEESYKFKKDVLDFCSKRKFLKNKNIKSTEIDEINLKQKQINKLYTQIEDINQDMSK